MTHIAAEAVGFGAAALTTFSLIPQIERIRRRRSADDISTAMFTAFAIGVLLWLVYGVLLGSWPMMLANGVSLVLAIAILALKFHFAPPAHLNGKTPSAGAKLNP